MLAPPLLVAMKMVACRTTCRTKRRRKKRVPKWNAKRLRLWPRHRELTMHPMMDIHQTVKAQVGAKRKKPKNQKAKEKRRPRKVTKKKSRPRIKKRKH